MEGAYSTEALFGKAGTILPETRRSYCLYIPVYVDPDLEIRWRRARGRTEAQISETPEGCGEPLGPLGALPSRSSCRQYDLFEIVLMISR
jgi:hypothetical protein